MAPALAAACTKVTMHLAPVPWIVGPPLQHHQQQDTVVPAAEAVVVEEVVVEEEVVVVAVVVDHARRIRYVHSWHNKC